MQRSILCSLICVMVLAANAQTSSPAIVIRPHPAVTPSGIGANRQLRVRVVDQRPSRQLYISSQRVAVSNDLATALREAIAVALRSKGFTPVDERPVDGRELTVAILELGWGPAPLVGMREAQCVLQPACSTAADFKLFGQFRGQASSAAAAESLFKRATAPMHLSAYLESDVNGALSIAVQTMIEDEQLLHCLGASEP